MGLVSFSKFVKEYKKKFPSSSINILEEVGNNVIIEDEFGKCKIRKQHLLNGITPSINSSLDKNYYFKNKANKIHNSKYNYSLVNYISANKKITIICNVHGKFNQEANSHLNGRGCPICKKLNISNYHSNNPTGWTKSNWYKNSKTSKNFESFKLYIIECYNETEKFYKIGRTFVPIGLRFKTKKEMPYNYNVLKIVEGDSDTIYNLEIKLKNMNKDNKYIPLLNFNGSKECFNNIKHIY